MSDLSKWVIELYQTGTDSRAFFEVMATSYDVAEGIGQTFMANMPEVYLDLRDGYGEREMFWNVSVEEASSDE